MGGDIMNRIIVAFESDIHRRRICDLLESSGIFVRGSYKSGSEVIRMIRKMGGGIVICGYKLPEMTASDLAYDLRGTSALVLLVAPAPMLDQCENPDVFKLPIPVSKRDLLASLNVLIQMEEKHLRASLPQRTSRETTDITLAKELLMSKNGLTEKDAHLFIQKKSMSTGSKMAEIAKLIIESYDLG